MKQAITLMHGYTCTLKTTISKALASKTGFHRIETKQFGPIKTAGQKTRRYELLSDAASKALREGRSVILDGTFSKYEYRNRIYRLADQRRINDVSIIYCLCEDEDEILKRLATRQKNEGVCFGEWLEKTHDNLTRDKARFEALKIRTIDTANFSI